MNKENQLTKMLDKYPDLRDMKLKACELEILLKDELNGAESAGKLNMEYVIKEIEKLKLSLKESKEA